MTSDIGEGARPAAPSRERPWASIGSLVGLLLLAGAMLLPWWSLGSTGSLGSVTFEFTLTGLCARPPGACSSYGSLAASTPAYGAVGGVFSVALGLTAVAMLAALLALLLSLLRGKPRTGAGIPAAASGVAALVGPLYAFVALPGAVSSLPYASVVSGFFGGLSASGTTVTWGGGLGWALSLGASAILLVSGLGVLALGRRKRNP